MPAKSKPKKCIVPNCKRDQVARNLCHPHYRKATREGLLLDIDGAHGKREKTKAIAQLQLDGRTTRWQ